MTDVLNIAWEVLQELFRSDVDGHTPHPVYSWLAVFVAHIGIGLMVALSPARKIATYLLIGFIVKELAFDLRFDGYVLRTWADSAADVCALVLGYGWCSWATGRGFLGRGLIQKPFPQ